MILLPLARPAYIRSFSFVVDLLATLLLTVVLHWFALNTATIFVLVLALGFLLLSLARPRSLLPLYKQWNVAANYFARFARLFLTGICFYVVLLAGARAGTSVSLARTKPDESLWLTKVTLSPETYH